MCPKDPYTLVNGSLIEGSGELASRLPFMEITRATGIVWLTYFKQLSKTS